MSETGRIARLEDLLARVRDRTGAPSDEAPGSFAPGSVGPDSSLLGVSPGALPSDDELDPLVSHRAFERALEQAAPPPPREALADEVVEAPGSPGDEGEEEQGFDRDEVRRALARRIDEALADDEPSVPFEEEGEGWEAEPLGLERDDAPLLEGATGEVLLVPDSGEPRMPLSTQVSIPPPPLGDVAVAYAPTKALEHAVKQATGVPVSAPPVADDAWRELTSQLRERKPSSKRSHLVLEARDSDRPAPEDAAPSPPRAVVPPPVVVTPPDGTPANIEARPTEATPAPREARRRRKGARGRRVASAVAAAPRERGAAVEPTEPAVDVPPTRRSAHAPPAEEEGSMLRTIAVGFVISAIALGLGLWLGRSSGSGATPDPTAAVAAVAPPRVEPQPAARPTAAPALPATATPPALTASERKAAPATEPPPGPLREEEAWLLVQGDELQVYVQGALAGNAGQWLKVPCGIRHVRLADASPPPERRSFPAWMGEGGPLSIPCRGQTSVRAEDVAKP